MTTHAPVSPELEAKATERLEKFSKIGYGTGRLFSPEETKGILTKSVRNLLSK